MEQLDKEFSNIEITDMVTTLKTGKSAGEDSILNEMIKHGIKQLLPHIRRLFNQVLVSEQVPSSWGHGLIVPLYKSGDRNEPGNYRGITLSSSLCKLFNTLMNYRLTENLMSNEILCRTVWI